MSDNQLNDKHKRSPPKAENSNLPLVNEAIKDEDIQHTITQLLKEASRLKPRIDENTARLTEIKEELVALALAYNLSGFRYNKVGFRYSGSRSHRVLSKEKLVYVLADAGIPADKINECYVDAKEFEDAKIILFD